MRALLLVLLVPGISACLGAPLPDAAPPARVCERLVEIPEPFPPPVQVPAPSAPPQPHPPARDLYSRDDFGVPHITVGSATDAWYALGYAMAEDRLWQLEYKRRASTGTLAEVLGTEALEEDRLARIRGFTPAERRALAFRIEPDALLSLTGYVAGINARIDEVQRDPSLLPAEFSLYALAPQAWTPEDVIAVMTEGAGFGSEVPNARVLLHLLQTVGEERAMAYFNDLVPAGSSDAPASVPAEEFRYAPRGLPPAAFPNQIEWLRAARGLFAEPGAGDALEQEQNPGGPPPLRLPRSGSNAVAIAGTHTASGRPILLGGPQVGYSSPPVYWEAVLDVAGARWHVFVKPGETLLRGLLHASATVYTTGYGDQVDLVLLKLDPQDLERYPYGEESLPFASREERFVVVPRRATGDAARDPLGNLTPDEPNVVVETVRRSHLGPVVVYRADMGYALVEQESSRGAPLAAMETYLDPRLPELSRDPVAIRAALRAMADGIGGSDNMVMAFSDGVIALYHNGRVPFRALGYDGRLPRPGLPEYDWAGLWGPECLPRLEDPRQGFLVNWNNNPAQGWPNLAPMPWMWGKSHRVEPLQELVRDAVGTGRLTLDHLNAINERASKRDMYAQHVIPGLLRLAGEGNAATAAVGNWIQEGFPMRDDDGDGRVDDAGLAAYEAWRELLQEAVFGDELGPLDHAFRWGRDVQGANYDDHGISFWTESVLGTLLDGGAAADWWDDVGTPERETAEGIVAATLPELLDHLGERWGATPDDWKRPMIRVGFVPLGLMPELSMPHTNRGSINYLVDFATGEFRTVLPAGESGHVSADQAAGLQRDPHWDDQLEMFTRFEYKVEREPVGASDP